MFETLASCSQINVPRFVGILASSFQTEKTKRSGTAHEACCNGFQLMSLEDNDNLNK